MKSKKVNIDIDEEKEGVSYEKGLEFEKQFATFLRNELQWDKVRVGAHMPGRNNAKGTSIDVFGERLDYVGVKYQMTSNRWLAGSIICMISSLIWFFERWGEHGLWLFLLSLVALMGVCASQILSANNNKQNAWVECKNLKTKVTVSHINKTLTEFNDYKATKNEDYKFTHHYFASANGYVENALKMATDNNILCYVKDGKSFKEVNYWEEKKPAK